MKKLKFKIFMLKNNNVRMETSCKRYKTDMSNLMTDYLSSQLYIHYFGISFACVALSMFFFNNGFEAVLFALTRHIKMKTGPTTKQTNDPMARGCCLGQVDSSIILTGYK